MVPLRRVRIPEGARSVFEGRLFSIFQWNERLFDGTTTTFEMARRPDNVIVVGLSDDLRLLATVQTQPGLPEPFVDFPGGRVDTGETSFDAARREMREETGFEAECLELIFQFQPSDRVDSVTSIYRATGLYRLSPPTPDRGEQVEVVWLTLAEVQQLALTNHRLALVPVLLAKDVSDLASGAWLQE